MKAFCCIREQPNYRRHAFVEGLKRVGYDVVCLTIGAELGPIGKDDIIVIWNRYGWGDACARLFPNERVIVCENGYLGKDAEGRQTYAIAIGGHNGSGTWHAGGPERWDALGIDIQPWRKDGKHILVCGQRGFGYQPMAMRDNWPDVILEKLRAVTDRPIWFRRHPERQAREPQGRYDKRTDHTRQLSYDLENAWAVVVWTSNSATKALIAGVPAFFDGPHIVTEGATERGLANLESPTYPERLPVMQRLAWCQFFVSEIEAGLPFQNLLRDARKEAA